MVDNLITLYDSNERNFTTNGLGTLVDASECTVEEELNGAFELTMSYPIDGQHYTDLGIGKIIFAKPNRQSEKEPFRIYSISTPLSGTVTVKAQHISYDLSGYILPKFNTDYSESGEAYATGPRTAFARIESELAKIPEYSDFPFTFYTDSDEDYAGQDVMYELTCPTPKSVRNMLGSGDGSMLSVYSGEYYFNRFAVNFLVQRGSDNGVILRYGKNLTSLTVDEDASTLYSGVYPFWRGTVTEKDANGQDVQNEKCIELPEKIITITEDAPKNVYLMDLSSDYTSWPGDENVREIVEKYISDNALGLPFSSLKVSYEQLSKSNEYSSFINFDSVELGDYVTVEYGALLSGPQKVRCTKISYDVLIDKIESIDLGSESTLTDSISQQQSTLSNSTNYTREYVQEQLSNISYDTALSTTSTNAVQNKVVTSKFNEMKRCCNEVKGEIEYLKEFVSSAGGTLSYGTDIPTGGEDGDGYVQVAQGGGSNPVTLTVGNNSGNWAVNNFTPSGKKYSFTVAGTGNSQLDIANINATNLIPDREYRVVFTAKMSSNATYYNGPSFTFGVNVAEYNSLIIIEHNDITRGTYDSSRRYQSFYEDNTTHDYSFTFRTGASENEISLSFSFHDVQDDNQVTLAVTNFTMVDTSSGDNEIIDLWFKIDGEWLKYQVDNESVFTYGTADPDSNTEGDIYAKVNDGTIDSISYKVDDNWLLGPSGGGGGGGSGATTELLYSGNSLSNSIQLSKPWTDFDALYILGAANESGSVFEFASTLFKDDLATDYRIGITTDIGYIWYSITNNTTLSLMGAYTGYYIKAIRGIKFSGGSGGGYTKTLLYDSGSDTVGAPYDTDIPLLDSLNNYDFVMADYGVASDRSNPSFTSLMTCRAYAPVDELLNGYDLTMEGYGTRYCHAKFTNTTFNLWWYSDYTVFKLYGIKLSGGGSGGGGSDIPIGGTTGQVLGKLSNTDRDIGWIDKIDVPAGGNSGQVFGKLSGTDYDFGWINQSGGSGGGIINDILYSASSSVPPSAISLAHPYTDYDYIVIDAFAPYSNELVYSFGNVYPTGDLEIGLEIGATNNDYWCWYTITDSQTLTVSAVHSDPTFYIKSIRGIKLSGGSGGSGGVTRETIWTGNAYSGSGYNTTTKPITDYDLLLCYHYDYPGVTTDEEAHLFWLDPKRIADNNYAVNYYDGNFEYSYYGSMYIRGKFTNATTFIIGSGSDGGVLFRIDGIKFSGGSGGGGQRTETPILDSPITTTGTYQVTDYSDADELVFEIGVYSGGVHQVFTTVVLASTLRKGWDVFVGQEYFNGGDWAANASIRYVDDTHIKVNHIGGAQWGETKTIFSIIKVCY